MIYVHDIVSLGVVGMVMYPMLRFMTTRDVNHVIFATAMLGADAITKLIKSLTRDSKHEIYARPPGALNCDLLCRNGLVEGEPGMPSGHMTITGLFVVYFLAYELKWDVFNPGFWAVLGIIPLMANARMSKSCHTLPQVVAGTGLGGMIGLAVYKLVIGL